MPCILLGLNQKTVLTFVTDNYYGFSLFITMLHNACKVFDNMVINDTPDNR